MEVTQIDALLRLIIAHLLADFIFQSDKIVKEKKKGLFSKYFYIHIFIVGFLTYLIYAQWSNWLAPALMIGFHAAIDLFRIKNIVKNPGGFLLDQMLHFLSILFIWIIVTDNTFSGVFHYLINTEIGNPVFIIIIAYLLISLPTSILIGQMTMKWQKEISVEDSESLTSAGKWIGIIERLLIMTFILIGQWAPIGFLLAGKSVFRFGDLNRSGERKKTEYILLGTLLSFTTAIIIGILAIALMGNRF